MKKDDYVLVEGAGLGKITLPNFHKGQHLVWLLNGVCKFATLKSESQLTPIDKSVADILNINESE